MQIAIKSIFLTHTRPRPSMRRSRIHRAKSQTIESSGANGHAHAVQDLRARARYAASFNSESVLILYGTVTGNSETLAKKLADALRPTGLTARVRDMAHCQPNVLTQANYLLVVASTYGDGEPPDDAAPFLASSSARQRPRSSRR